MSGEQWWTGTVRDDGLTIARGIDGYVIMPKHGLNLDRCPCCDKAFAIDDRGLRGARLVADFMFPMTRPAKLMRRGAAPG